MNDSYTVKEYALAKNVSEETVRRWLRNGKITGAYRKSKKIGWVIPANGQKKQNDIDPWIDAIIFHVEEIVKLREKELEHLKKIHEYCLDMKYYQKEQNNAS